MKPKVLIFLCCLSPVCSEPLTVLESPQNVSDFVPTSGAALHNSSLQGQKQITMCARFLNHQFTANNYQALLTIAQDHTILWSTWNPEINAGTSLPLRLFKVWDLGVWNHVCCMLDSTLSQSQIILNGKTILLSNDYSTDHNTFPDHNLSIMGYPTKQSIDLTNGSFVSSFFGRMTDVNIWSRIFTKEEAIAWTQCEKTEGGD